MLTRLVMSIILMTERIAVDTMLNSAVRFKPSLQTTSQICGAKFPQVREGQLGAVTVRDGVVVAEGSDDTKNLILVGEGRSAASSLPPPSPVGESVESAPRATPGSLKRTFLLAALLANFALWGTLATLKALAPKLGAALGIEVEQTGVLLFSAFAATFGMLGLNKLPKPHHPIFNAAAGQRASQDKFLLCIEASDPLFDKDKVTEFMNTLNAESVEYIETSEGY